MNEQIENSAFAKETPSAAAEFPPVDAHEANARGRFPWQPLWRVIRVLLLSYLGFILLVMWMEESLIFFPSKYPDGLWDPPGLAIEDAHFHAADGTALHGWYAPHEAPLAYVLYLHGNAGNITDRAEVLRRLHDTVGAAVLIVDYRGYGKSAGSPNERGVLEDARAARAWLAERAGIEPSQIVLMGRSLGGAVAVDLTTDVAPRALVLESTFTSLPDVAAVHYPYLPVRLLMNARLDSRSKIGAYQGPLLQSHGTADEVIPYRLGKELFDAATTKQKEFIDLPRQTHNDLPLPQYYERLRQFLAQLAPTS